jgi:hypothetical protein
MYVVTYIRYINKLDMDTVTSIVVINTTLDPY